MDAESLAFIGQSFAFFGLGLGAGFYGASCIIDAVRQWRVARRHGFIR
jgi:hypothetical protein